ncbi:MAG: ABC transporter substrate-binding protein [Anaerolineae bacterium]|nr:ABC transporter substrate-binding protein [Anaerolineae bacterium]
MKKYLFLLSVFVLILAACGGEAPTEMTQIKLPMGYIPDPQYAPFYVAADKGYYAEEGLEIEFDYSFETDGVALVGAGERPFAIVSGDQVILARAQSLPIVYVMEWFQKYPIAVISKADAGIETPEDLAGRNVGLPGFFGASYVGYVGLLESVGLAEGDVDGNDIGFNQVESLLADQSEAVVGYGNNEPLQLQSRGEDINIIYVADYIDLVANGIITNEMLLAENPELVEAFVRATLRGLADTLANPEEAYEISKKFVEGLDDSRLGVLEASLPMWQATTLGQTEAASWQQTQAVLLKMGFLDAPVENLDAAFTNDVIEKVQP